jgi:Domain of unknown function (DUF4349)
MASKASFLFIAVGVLMIVSCNRNYENQKANADVAAIAADTTAIQQEEPAKLGKYEERAPAQAFIRTADIRFRVTDVVRSTEDIEDITRQAGGFVTLTRLTSDVSNVSTVPVTRDSMMESKTVLVTNNLTIRVPNKLLDTTLKQISASVDFLDSRVITADDAALQMLSNRLLQARSARNQGRLSIDIDHSKGKLADKIQGEETLTGRAEERDDALVENLSLRDKVEFSTVTLQIYQREKVVRTMLPIIPEVKPYEPGFGSQFAEALSSGVDALEGMVLMIVRLWVFIVLGVVVYAFVKRYGVKRLISKA